MFFWMSEWFIFCMFVAVIVSTPLLVRSLKWRSLFVICPYVLALLILWIDPDLYCPEGGDSFGVAMGSALSLIFLFLLLSVPYVAMAIVFYVRFRRRKRSPK
jgi:uncharacterized membrane protein YgaE (UPF0421/DUF939 family)